MKPPIRIDVRTDNRANCELRFTGADSNGVATVIPVPAHGNVYQGLHAARGHLEEFINKELLGYVPPPAEEEQLAADVAEDDAEASALAPSPDPAPATAPAPSVETETKAAAS